MSKTFKSTLGNLINENLQNFGNLETEVRTAEKRSDRMMLAASAGKRRQLSILSVDPKRCKLWAYHNRLQEYLNEFSCVDLIESIKSNGQEQPALARELKGDSNYDYEIIYGSRRKFSCEYLGKDLDIYLTNQSDKDCVAIMDIENRARKDISDFERSLDYKNWLDHGLYSTYEELAKSIGVTKGWVSQIMKMTELPSYAINAFETPLDIKPKYAYEIMRFIKSSQENEQIAKQNAEALVGKGYDGLSVFKKIMRLPTIAMPHSKSDKKIIIKRNSNGTVTIKINASLSLEKVKQLEAVISQHIS